MATPGLAGSSARRRRTRAFAALLACGAGAALAAPKDALPKQRIPDRDPVALVRAFIEADAQGMQTDSDRWPLVQRFTTWETGPGWDGVTVITAAAIIASEVKAKTATVSVRYSVFGELHEDGALDPVLERASAAERTVVFQLARQRGGGWKIASPQGGPLVSIPWLLGTRYSGYCRAHDCGANPVFQELRREDAAHPFARPR